MGAGKNLGTLKTLMRQDVDIFAQDSDGRTALHRAVEGRGAHGCGCLAEGRTSACCDV